MSHVAVLGTGLLGSGMVEALRAKGVAVRAWNRSLDKARALEAHGATVAATAADAVRGAERVHLVLSNDEAVDAVLADAGDAIGSVVIDHSTVSRDGAIRRTAQFSAAGRRYVHAPVFMSPQNAREAKGIMLLSGPDLEPVAEILKTMTGRVQVVGDQVGQAAVWKLLGNAALISMVAGIADVLSIARANDLDEGAVMDFFGGFDPSISMRARGGMIARRAFEPASFTVQMARKDVGLMLAAAQGAELVVLPSIAERMDQVIGEGLAASDLAVIGRPERR